MPHDPITGRERLAAALRTDDAGAVLRALGEVGHDLGPTTAVLLCMEAYQELPDDVRARWQAEITMTVRPTPDG